MVIIRTFYLFLFICLVNSLYVKASEDIHLSTDNNNPLEKKFEKEESKMKENDLNFTKEIVKKEIEMVTEWKDSLLSIMKNQINYSEDSEDEDLKSYEGRIKDLNILLQSISFSSSITEVKKEIINIQRKYNPINDDNLLLLG